MPAELFHPSAVIQSYRTLNPGKFDEFTDSELLDAIQRVDPATYKLVDPQLIGAELLGDTRQKPAGAAPPAKIPTPRAKPGWLDTGVTTGLRVGGMLGGGLLGSATDIVSGPVGTAVGAGAGAAAGDQAAQLYERTFGLRDDNNLAETAIQAGLGMVPLGEVGELGLAGRTAVRAGQGAALGRAGGLAESLVTGQPPGPALPEYGVGAVTGAAFHGAGEVVDAGRAAVSGLGEATGALPGGPPGAPSAADQLPLAVAAAQQHEQEETAALTKLTAVYGPGAKPVGSADYHTALQQKSYLEELSDLQQPPVPIPPVLAQAPPPAPPPQSLLEAGDFSDPNLQDVLPPPNAGPASTVDRFGGQLEGALQAPPGPPRLIPGEPQLHLSPPPEAPIPRGNAEVQPPLLVPAPPRKSTSGPIEQTGEMGGRESTREQPRLPGTDQPTSIDREYATGPNAGPRRPGEVHAQPRPLRRQVRTGKAVKYEKFPSTLPAEDPGTYPPDVRRELARMAEEMTALTYEPPGSIETPGGEGNRDKGFMHYTRATPGAAVSNEILEAAEAQGHTTRAGVLKAVRDALLEGKGSHLSDVAAQVARERIAQEGTGARRGAHAIQLPPGAGDALIHWEDPAGNTALPQQELGEHARAARDASDGDLLNAVRLRDVGHLNPDVEEAVVAAEHEAVRRGLVDLRQPDLAMEGPGGNKGPGLFDFEGGPPGKPEGGPIQWGPEAGAESRGRISAEKRVEDLAAQRGTLADIPDTPEARELERQRREANGEPPLPGLEGVRSTENPMPPVAEAPYALIPPPAKPAARLRDTPNSPDQPLLKRLFGEEGVLILPKIPAGDRAGLKSWLKTQEKEHGGDAWFSRVEQHLEDGNYDKAWKAAVSASVQSYARAAAQTTTPQQEAALAAAVKGTALQADIHTQIVASARTRAGVGTAPPVKDFPPSSRVSQAGAARGKATLGPAGILNPGAPKRPLSAAAPELRHNLLSRSVVEEILKATPTEGIATIPGQADTFLRLYRQIGEKVYQGQNVKLLREAGVRIPPEELAQHFNQTVQEWARGLQSLQQFATANKTTLEAAAQQMSMGGALRGLLKGEPPPRFVGAGGREVSPAGRVATMDAIAKDTNVYEQAMVANTLQKKAPVGVLQALNDASYSYMLSKWNTAVRNYVTFVGRYSVESLDHALTIPLAHLTGDTDTATLSTALLKERGVTPMRPGTAPEFKGVWGDTLQEVHNFTTDALNQLNPKDARRSIRLLLDLPEAAAQYLGSSTGEDLSSGFSDTPVMRYLTNPRLQRMLTTFNRAQEFSARATVFDGTMRALLRAKGLDPTETLLKPTSEIAQAVGGKPALDDMLYTATAGALEATFAGRASKDSIPGALIRFVNEAWPLKLGMPFPKFNFSSAPRFLYDHGPAALLDLVRYPLDAAGITAPEGTVAGGRLYRGMRAQTIERKTLPNLQLEMGKAEKSQGEALAELLSTQKEIQIRTRQVDRLTARQQPGLEPGGTTPLSEATALRDQLLRRRETLKTQMQESRRTVGDLKSEQKRLLGVLADARNINAPNFSQYLARIGTGTMGGLGAAWIIRAQPGAEGTKWYEFNVPDPREGHDPHVLDFRPFAPFAQYLYVADVLHDFYKHTDWDAYHKELASNSGSFNGPLDHTAALWNNYEGKYTAEELGSQFAQAFFSISRAAGTTLTITDLLTKEGVPGPRDIADALVGTIGQFLSRFTTPFGMARDVIGQFDPEEAKIRTPPRATLEEPGRPLAGPIANLPYASRLIPEQISQTTGQPIATEYPGLRAVAGIGSTSHDYITEEIRRVGVPGSSVYIRETGDVGIDRLNAENYSKILQEEMPGVLEDPEYVQLGTPARQRDYLSRYIFPALKRAALGETREALGDARYTEATVTGEGARKKVRQQKMLDALEGELPAAPVDPDGPPPGPPTGAAPDAGGPPPAF